MGLRRRWIAGLAVAAVVISGTFIYRATHQTSSAVRSSSSSSSAMAELNGRLADLGTAHQGADAQTAFDELDSAISGAVKAGVNPDTVHQAVVVADVRTLSTPDGANGLLATDTALEGHTVGTAGAPSAPSLGAGLSTPGQGRLAAVRTDSPSSCTSPVCYYYVNGVGNTWDDAVDGTQRLESTLGVRIELVYDRSALDAKAQMDKACIEARRSVANNPNPDNVTLVNSLCPLRSAIGAAGTAATALTFSAPQLILQRTVDANSGSDPVNATLVPKVRDDIKNGRRVVLLSHSQGGLFLRNALDQLAGMTTACGDPPPVAALYIAPPFGSGDALQKNPTRYVMLDGDFLLKYPNGPGAVAISSVNPTSVPKAPQSMPEGTGTADSIFAAGFRVHFLDNYLMAGSESRQQVIDRFNELVQYVSNIRTSASVSPQRHVGPATAPRLADDAPCSAPTDTSSPFASETPAPTDTSSPSASETPAPSEAPSPTPTPSPTPVPASYYVFLLTSVENGEPYVGTEADLIGQPTCSFVDGGQCMGGGADPPVQYTKELGPFASQDEATRAYCSALSNVHSMPLGGSKGTIFGGDYYLDNAPSC